MATNDLLFGLSIDSEIDFAGFAAGTTDRPADMTVKFSAIGADVDQRLTRVSRFALAGQGELLQDIPDIARLHITGGNSIVIEPAKGADHASIRTFLLGTPIACAMLQRKMLVLHGNATAIDGQSVICVGKSGAGKSTLAKALMDRGHSVFADDLSVIDADHRVLPGIARIKLWQDAANRLEVDTGKLARILPDRDKFALPITAPGSAAHDGDAMPVGAIVELQPSATQQITVKRLEGLERLKTVRRHVFRARFLKHMGLWPDLLPKVAALAAEADVYTIERPLEGFDIGGLVQTVETIRAGEYSD